MPTHRVAGTLGHPPIEGETVANQSNRWPTWVVVVAIIILIPVIVWALSLTMSLLAAMSIGGVLLIAAIVGLFVWLRGRVDERR